MTRWPLLAPLLAGGLLSTCPSSPHPNFPSDLAGTTVTDSLVSAGVQRRYTVHFPTGYQPGGSMPMLVAFHGSGGTGYSMQFVIGDSIADQAGVVTVYPEAAPGTNGTWALGCTDCTYADAAGIDDYRFARDLLGTLARRYGVSLTQVYIVGFSLGASFVYDWACRDSDRLRGILVIASLPSPEELPGCRPGRPLEVMIMNGDLDPNIPWTGGGQYNYLSADSSARLWRQRDGCQTGPSASQLPDRNNDGRFIGVTIWQDCVGGVRVRLFRIHGGGHAFPPSDFSVQEALAEMFRF
jgi:polyhydroxybutyrate depolymerase